MKLPAQIKKIFEKESSFLLASHENPDSDALGSMLALANLLESLGKSVFLYNAGVTPSFLEFLPGSERMRTTLADAPENGFDTLIVLDCPAISRAGADFERYAAGSDAEIVIIDHHTEAGDQNAVKWVETAASATAILVYEIFKSFGAAFTPQSATCIFAAISGDTGSFRFSNATAECFAVASEMVLCGADPQRISSAVYENQSAGRIDLLSLVLGNLQTDETGKVAWICVDREMFEATGTSGEDTEGMVDYPMSLKGVEVAMLFRETSGRGQTPAWKGSIRSRGDIDVCAVAAKFGGGGHKNAAGFNFEGGFDDAIGKILDAIKRV